MSSDWQQPLESESGSLFQFPGGLCFFGKKPASIERLKADFPQISFTRIKQVHKDGLCQSNIGDDLSKEADAHFSEQKNHGLCIATADCAPVFLFCENLRMVAGIHAGWRGVAQRIVPKTIQHFIAQGAQVKKILIFLGPHIQQPSFEVGLDVRDQILKSVHTPAGNFSQMIGTEKARVDLHRVLISQIREFALPDENTILLKRDTFSDTAYHSFRRDKESSGRQLSFLSKVDMSKV